MTVKDLVCMVIGLPADFLDWLQKISDNIDVDLSCDDICDAIAELSDPSEPWTIGMAVAIMVMDKIKDHFKEKYPNFDEDKFNYELNGLASRLYYDSQLIISEDDMDHIMEDEEAA